MSSSNNQQNECQNCGAYDHETNACDQPCGRCNIYGHRWSQCQDHWRPQIARDIARAAQGGQASVQAPARVGRGVICFRCQRTGHKVENCPLTECHVCKQKGHIAMHCPNDTGKAVAESKCYNCGEKGHKANKCPKKK
ncbi:hypothetical protein BT63DRAFT_437738 [Microthyrium microscopicum]|uniref:CCHC-type domain-containing protein n=1 Tax=Microthyrium microscopicum TaxID=703497 RepID=A0A6A6ULL3_9PEZI|nr:hypothetical protein BT63DRAFT_437738 [Microthyrium microscopicum]